MPKEEEINRILNSLEMKYIYGGLKDVDFEIRSTSRKKVKKWLKQNPKHTESIFNQLTTHAKRELFEEIQYQDYIRSTEGGGENKEDGRFVFTPPEKLDKKTIFEKFDLKDFYYFDSFFHYTDHSYRLFNISNLGSVFQKIHNEAKKASEAKKILVEFCKEKNFSSNYLNALESTPSPLIGDVNNEPKPRLIKVEDEEHIYAEFWSLGKEINDFDVNTGDYKSIETLDKAVIRIHLDTGHIEFTSDSGRVKRRRKIIRSILTNFNIQGNPTKSDIDEMFNQVEITDQQIRKVKRKLGVLSTLDEFRGSTANLRFTSVKKRNVETDPSHSNTAKNRDYRKSHPRMIFGEKDNKWQFIYPKKIFEYAEDEPEEEETLKEILNELAKKGDYDEVEQFTAILNSDTNTIRIWKKKITPGMRRLIFHLLRSKLGW